MEWKNLSIQNGPSPRYGHTATIVNGELYIFGGHLSQALFSRSFAINKKENVLNDLWKLDLGITNLHLNTPANFLWVRIKTLDRSKPWPEGRYFHSTIAYKNLIITYGGQGERQTFDSTWAFDTDTKEWSKWDCTSFYSAEENKVATRYKHTATLYNDLMIVCGGKESKIILAKSTISILDLKFRYWISIPFEFPQSVQIRNHTAVLDLQHIWMYGGALMPPGSSERIINEEIWQISIESLLAYDKNLTIEHKKQAVKYYLEKNASNTSVEDEKTFYQLVEEVIGSLLSREISKLSDFDRSLLRLSAKHRSRLWGIKGWIKILFQQLPTLYDLPSKILVLELLEHLTAGDSLCRNALTAVEYKTPSKLHPEVHKLKEFFPDHLRKVQLNLALFHPPELDPKPISLEELEKWRKEKNTNTSYYNIIVALITQYKNRFEGSYTDLTLLWNHLMTDVPLDQAKLVARSLAIAYSPLDQSQMMKDIAAIVEATSVDKKESSTSIHTLYEDTKAESRSLPNMSSVKDKNRARTARMPTLATVPIGVVNPPLEFSQLQILERLLKNPQVHPELKISATKIIFAFESRADMEWKKSIQVQFMSGLFGFLRQVTGSLRVEMSANLPDVELLLTKLKFSTSSSNQELMTLVSAFKTQMNELEKEVKKKLNNYIEWFQPISSTLKKFSKMQIFTSETATQMVKLESQLIDSLIHFIQFASNPLLDLKPKLLSRNSSVVSGSIDKWATDVFSPLALKHVTRFGVEADALIANLGKEWSTYLSQLIGQTQKIKEEHGHDVDLTLLSEKFPHFSNQKLSDTAEWDLHALLKYLGGVYMNQKSKNSNQPPNPQAQPQKTAEAEALFLEYWKSTLKNTIALDVGWEKTFLEYLDNVNQDIQVVLSHTKYCVVNFQNYALELGDIHTKLIHAQTKLNDFEQNFSVDIKKFAEEERALMLLKSWFQNFDMSNLSQKDILDASPQILREVETTITEIVASIFNSMEEIFESTKKSSTDINTLFLRVEAEKFSIPIRKHSSILPK